MEIKIIKLECKRCGHNWIPKKEEVRQCPKCKSSWWDKEKTIKYFPCPKEKEFWEEQYVKLGKSTTMIAKEFNYCKQSIIDILNELKLIRTPSDSKKSEKNPQWKGDEVGLCALHEWIASRKPKTEFCECCNKNVPYDLANISGEYKRDINDFEWLCRSCHMHKDGRLKNLKCGKITQNPLKT